MLSLIHNAVPSETDIEQLLDRIANGGPTGPHTVASIVNFFVAHEAPPVDNARDWLARAVAGDGDGTAHWQSAIHVADDGVGYATNGARMHYAAVADTVADSYDVDWTALLAADTATHVARCKSVLPDLLTATPIAPDKITRMFRADLRLCVVVVPGGPQIDARFYDEATNGTPPLAMYYDRADQFGTLFGFGMFGAWLIKGVRW